MHDKPLPDQPVYKFDLPPEQKKNILRATECLQRHVEGMATITAEHIEKLAAAFIAETGLTPSEAELVQQTVGTEIRWWFRKREAS